MEKSWKHHVQGDYIGKVVFLSPLNRWSFAVPVVGYGAVITAWHEAGLESVSALLSWFDISTLFNEDECQRLDRGVRSHQVSPSRKPLNWCFSTENPHVESHDAWDDIKRVKVDNQLRRLKSRSILRSLTHVYSSLCKIYDLFYGTVRSVIGKQLTFSAWDTSSFSSVKPKDMKLAKH